MTARFFTLWVSVSLWFITSVVFAQAPKTARITDFNAPNVDPSGRKSIVRGADAEPTGAGIFKITKPHVDNYKADGALDNTIDASECMFDSRATHDVWSDKDLLMKTTDGRLSLKGVGFRFSNSHLTVSNKVEAIIRRQVVANAVGAAKPGAPATNDFLRVTADSLEHSAEFIVFKGGVRVVDPQGEVRCDLLKVKLDEKNAPQEIEALDNVILLQQETEARGKRALYNPNSGLLKLFENARWRMGDREGESELLILDRTNKTLRAETKVKMTLPSSLLSTNAPAQGSTRASTNKLAISADTFDYAPTNTITHGAIAIFNGNVHAVDPQAMLDCELLTIFFDQTNHLARAVADRNVVITRPDGSIKGVRAVFEKDEITIPSTPTWRLKENSGSAELLVFNPRTREVRALKSVRMEIPVASQTNLLLSASAEKSTNSNPQTTVANILVVTADYFTNKDNIATFSEHVRASEPRGQIDANKIELHFNATNRVERVIADGDVILTEEKTQAIGQRADYDVAAGLIRLTGAPRVFSEDRKIIAEEFIVDRQRNRFQPVAPFRIEIRNLKKK
jgi:lipopolysaccharide export system protein LptA